MAGLKGVITSFLNYYTEMSKNGPNSWIVFLKTEKILNTSTSQLIERRFTFILHNSELAFPMLSNLTNCHFCDGFFKLNIFLIILLWKSFLKSYIRIWTLFFLGLFRIWLVDVGCSFVKFLVWHEVKTWLQNPLQDWQDK